MTDNSFWLALGAFVTSSGFGALIALGAAFLAYRNVTRTIEANRKAATEAANVQRELARKEHERQQDRELAADSRQRWWEALRWITDNLDHMQPEEAAAALEALRSTSLNAQQSAMLTAATLVAARTAMEGQTRQ